MSSTTGETTGLGAPLVLPSMDNTLGALLIGAFCAMALWGLTCAQTWYLFNAMEAKNTTMMKTLIACLFAVDTLHSALLCHVVYFYVVSNYMAPEALLRPTWSISALVLLVSICDFIIRGLFCQRIYRFGGRNLWISVPIMIVSVADLVVGIIIFSKALTVKSFMDLQGLKGLFYTNFATGVSSDVAVAFVMCMLLYGSRTGIDRTDTLLRKLMVYTVNSGLLVAIDALLGMVTYIAMPDNFVFIAFYCVMSKIYLNSYLALLNARDELRARVDADVISNSVHLTSMFRRQGDSYIVDEEVSEASNTVLAPEKVAQAQSRLRSSSHGSRRSDRSTLEISVHRIVDQKHDNIDSPVDSMRKEWR